MSPWNQKFAPLVCSKVNKPFSPDECLGLPQLTARTASHTSCNRIATFLYHSKTQSKSYISSLYIYTALLFNIIILIYTFHKDKRDFESFYQDLSNPSFFLSSPTQSWHLQITHAPQVCNQASFVSKTTPHPTEKLTLDSSLALVYSLSPRLMGYSFPLKPWNCWTWDSGWRYGQWTYVLVFFLVQKRPSSGLSGFFRNPHLWNTASLAV